MDTQHRIRTVGLAALGVAAVAAIVVPLGIGLVRSAQDDPARQRDYVCILATGDHC